MYTVDKELIVIIDQRSRKQLAKEQGRKEDKTELKKQKMEKREKKYMISNRQK